MMHIDSTTWRRARRALEKAIALFCSDPNVSHLDLGYRIFSADGNRLAPELAVRVHVRRKLYGKAFEAFAARHPERVIEAARIGFATDVPRATYQLDRWKASAALPREQRQSLTELHGGIPISNTAGQHTGTLGGIVRHRDSGEEMMLSTWHALAGSWNARPGGAIYQSPVAQDSKEAPVPIAEFTHHAMDANLDAALARLNGMRVLCHEQTGLGDVTGADIPQIGMKVIKSGGYTGVTSGIITGVLGVGLHLYDGVPRVIGHIVHITADEPGKTICAPGDSGAWWLECSTRRAVAMHFASSLSPHFALALSMPEVLAALKADIVATETPAYRRGRVSNAGIPKIPKRSSIPERKGTAFGKIAFGCLLALLFLATTRFGFRLHEMHLVQNEKIGQLQRDMVRLQSTTWIDSSRRHNIGKIIAIVDRLQPKMAGDMKCMVAGEIYAMCSKYRNLDLELICATITQETGWNPKAVSAAGALGLMQILPSTGIGLAQEEGIAWSSAEEVLFDPIYNLRLGCRYLAGLVQVYNLDAGLAAYNGGEKHAQRWLRGGRAHGILPEETAAYVPSVLRIYEKYRRMPH